MDVQGGQLIQSPLNPVWPGSRFSGPLLAGNILRTGGPNQAGLGSQDQNSLGNVGYARMSQAGRVTQVAGAGFASPDLVIPAQSLILSMSLTGVVAFTGAIGLGTPTNATFFTAAGAVASPPLGSTAVPAPTAAPFIANWLNVGNQDVQIVVTAASAGAGVGILVVDYIQGVNAPTS